MAAGAGAWWVNGQGAALTPHGSRTRSAGRRPSTERVSTGLAIDARLSLIALPGGQTE